MLRMMKRATDPSASLKWTCRGGICASGERKSIAHVFICPANMGSNLEKHPQRHGVAGDLFTSRAAATRFCDTSSTC